MEMAVQSPKNNEATVVKSQMNTRSMYEENYAKFIQTATNKTQSTNEMAVKMSVGNEVYPGCVITSTVQSNTLPKFNHVFGKTILSTDTIAASQTKTTTSTITLTVSDDDNDPPITSICQDAATQTSVTINRAKHSKKVLQTFIKDVKLINDNNSNKEKQKPSATANHVIYARQMPAHHLNQSTILQGINRMIQSTSVGSNNISTTATKKDIKIIHQPMSSNLPTGMRISMPMVTSSMQQIQTTKLIRPVIQLPPTILRSTGQGENLQQFLITTPGDPSSNVRYENLIVTATAPGQSTQSSSRNVDNSTLEQLREFDMVLEQVKERSTTTLITAPSQSSNISLKQSVNQLLTSGENQIVQATPDIIYTSNGQSVIQKVNLAYVQQHHLHNTPLVVVTNYCQPKASSSLTTPQNASVVSTSLTSPNKARNSNVQIAATQISLKSTSKVVTKPIIERSTVGVTPMVPKYTSTITTAVTNSSLSSTPIITTTAVSNNTTNSASSATSSSKPPPKLQEDEQTVQRIYNILAEYAEQLRNSPDLNNKPAPRRRCNIQSNVSNAASSSNVSTTSSNTSSTSKKRKSSQSSSSKRSANENELDRTLESEDSSGISLHDQNNSDDTSQHSVFNTTEKSPPVLVTSVPSSSVGLSSSVLTPIARSTTVSRQLIFADSVMTLCSSTGTSTSASLSSTTANNARQVLINDSTSGLCGKVGNETLLMPRNYVLPMSVIKELSKSGSQQYAIVTSTAQASKLLESGQLNHMNNTELWQQQHSTGTSQSAIVLQGFLNSFPRTTSSQPEQIIKQPLKIDKSDISQTFSNIEAANALCQTSGNGGGSSTIFQLQTIPTTMISSAPSTILNSLATSEAQSHNISAFARVPQQPKQSQSDLESNEQQPQPSRGIIIIENMKEEEREVTAATTNISTTTFVAKKRKFQDDDNSFNSSLIKNELKWSSDQYLDQSSPIKSECMMEPLSIPKDSSTSMSRTSQSSITNTTKISPAITSTSITETSKIITIPSSSDENLRFLISNPYQAPAKTKGELRNKHLRNNFILSTSGSSTGNRILLQQLCHERKQAAIERELRLQKSLSEECEDLGVGEPSTSDLFPEADLLFDTCSPAFDVSSQDNTSTPIDPSKQRIFFHTSYQTATHRANDCDDVKSSDDDEKRSKIETINDGTFKGSTTPNFLQIKEETYGDFEVISPFVQDNSNSSTGTNEVKPAIKVEQQNDDDVNVRNDETEEFTADIAGDFDKLKNSMDWEGGPMKTYSKSSFRGVKRTQESAQTSIIKTISSEAQSTLISVTSPAPVLHQRKITQYHNLKKKIPPNHKLNAIKTSSINSSIAKTSTQPFDATLINPSESKSHLISIQRKRRLSLNSSKSGEQSAKSTCTTTPYIHNHSIGSMSGNISSSFKININTDAVSTAMTMSSSKALSSSPKIINHQMRTGGSQASFDKDVIYGTTVNGSNAKANKQTKKR